MPKIHAATVAEHRAAQRQALIDSARAILAEGAAEPPSLAAVAARSGMARPSVYQYFRSREDLLDAVLADSLPRWSDRVSDRMGRETEPGAKVLAYALANLELVADGEHAITRGLAAVLRPERLAEQGRTIHDQLRAPLVRALTQFGSPDPEVAAELVNAVVHSASKMIENGADTARTTANLREILEPYLRNPPGVAGVRDSAGPLKVAND